MKNPMQLKAFVKNIATQKKISAQLVLQNYMLERLLERISVSRHREKFIIKGGFLIASMLGLDFRATMDMDATLKGMFVSAETVQALIEEVCAIDLNDSIKFTLNGISEIREDADYRGYRVSLTADYLPMRVPLKIDITTGDTITPREIEYEYKLMMENRSISVLAYNLVTILAEKLETIISRGDQNTRARDYYDVYVLCKLQEENTNIELLLEALLATAKKRGSLDIIKNYSRIIKTVCESEIMKRRWADYRKDFEYAKEIEFEETCTVITNLLESLKAKIGQ